MAKRERTAITFEIDPEDGSCGLFVEGEQIGALVVDESGTGLRLVLGTVDLGGGLVFQWRGDPMSVRMDLSTGIDHVLGGQR